MSSTFLALVVMSRTLGASDDSPPPPVLACPSVVRVATSVEGEGLEPGDAVLLERVGDRAAAVLRQWDVRPQVRPGDPVLTLVVARLPDDSGYRLGYGVVRGNERVEALEGSAECRLCTEDEFIDQAQTRIDGLVARLMPEATPVCPLDGPSTGSREPMSDTPPFPDKLQTAGTSVLAAGSLGLGFGVGLLVAAPLVAPDGEGPKRSLRIPGAAVAAAGTALVSAGIALLVVHARRKRGYSHRLGSSSNSASSSE